MRHRTMAWIAALGLLAGACDSPLDVTPRASVKEEEAYDEPAELNIAVMGLYDGLQDADGAYGRNTVVYPDLYADALDFTGTYQTDREVDQHTVTAENVAVEEIWADFYDVVNRANNVLAAAPALADEAGQDDVDGWMAQARFARALAYFNLVRFFGGVPLVLDPTWDLGGDFQPARATAAQVYAQIETDLTGAIPALPTSGSSYTATTWAAEMLLAKTEMEQGDYASALTHVGDVIDRGPFGLPANYADVFSVRDNDEMVFALHYTVNDNNNLAFWFFAEGYGGRWGFAPSSALENAYEGNERYDASIAYDNYYGEVFGTKFHRIAAGDDDVPVLRLADAYLMRAEANLFEGATAATVLDDINVVRQRAGLAGLDAGTVNTQAQLVGAIAHERFVELAMEGHRFFDLRRLGLAESTLGLDATQLLFPVPQREIDVNPNLVQNPGY